MTEVIKVYSGIVQLEALNDDNMPQKVDVGLLSRSYTLGDVFDLIKIIEQEDDEYMLFYKEPLYTNGDDVEYLYTIVNKTKILLGVIVQYYVDWGALVEVKRTVVTMQ